MILLSKPQIKIGFAIIGPEAPLEKGLADALWQHSIPAIGPKKKLAQLETSKAFTRDLLKKHHIQVRLSINHFRAQKALLNFYKN